LTRADLANAKLIGADLIRADLTDAKLAGAIVTSQQLVDTLGIPAAATTPAAPRLKPSGVG
jgi:uncharacterized protein YjbI with pentapeptide repeats